MKWNNNPFDTTEKLNIVYHNYMLLPCKVIFRLTLEHLNYINLQALEMRSHFYKLCLMLTRRLTLYR